MYKQVFISLMLGMALLGHSQERDLPSMVDALTSKIESAKGKDKLILLDSLTGITKYRRAFKFDSIANETIQLALQLKDYNIATRRTGDLIVFISNKNQNAEKGLDMFKATLQKNWKVTDSSALATLYAAGGFSYFSSGFEQEAVDCYERSEQLYLADKDTIQSFEIKAYKAFALSEMGKFATASQEYQRALEAFLRKKDSARILRVRMGLSILYGQNKFYEEAEKEFDAIHKLSLLMDDPGITIYNLGNRATNLYRSEDYIGCIRLSKEKLRLIEKHPEFEHTRTPAVKALVNSYLDLDSLKVAKVYFKQLEALLQKSDNNFVMNNDYLECETRILLAEGKLEQAEVSGLKLLSVVETSKNHQFSNHARKLLAEIYSALNQPAKAYYHLQNYSRIKDSIQEIDQARALAYYQTLYETSKRDALIQKQNDELVLLDSEKKAQFLWMGILSLILLAVGLLFYFNSEKNKQKTEIAKNKKALADMTNEMLNKEIEYKKKDLTRFAFNISENIAWSRILEEKMERIIGTKGEDREKEIEALESEIKKKIRIDESTEPFHEHIEQVSSGFYVELNEKYPDLTKNEVRLCTLVKMSLDNKAIATLQNIDISSVKKGIYRLRKKLRLDPEDDLDAFLRNF